MTDNTKLQHSCPNCGYITTCDWDTAPSTRGVDKRYHEPIILNAARLSRQEKARPSSFVSSTSNNTDLEDLQSKETELIELPPVPKDDPTFGYKRLEVVNGMPRKSSIVINEPILLPNPVPTEEHKNTGRGVWGRLWGWG